MLNTFLQAMADATKSLREGAQKMLKAGMLDRASIIVAMVSFWPDKQASQAETRKGILGIKSITGDVFNPREMEAKVQQHINSLVSDGEMGYQLLLRNLSGVRDKADARFLVQIAIQVGNSDGVEGQDPFSPEEKKVVAEIARALDLTPAEFGLVEY